jgi:hypothetical protein
LVDEKSEWNYNVNMLKNHLKARHLDLELHRPVLDEVENVATFYLWNLSGQMVGYQQYRPDGEKKPQNNPKEGKYFTYRKQPTLGLWGVESLHLSENVVFLCEGVFDACRMTEKGFSALASLSNNPTADLHNWLRMLNRYVVVVCDADNSGKRLAKFGDAFEVVQGYKDLGDASDEYVEFLLDKYSF